ncbi:AAA family ATPase [Streptosporangiaceae bacterium NEAU-GS5]|nr:AAA family ATPase [Streptosporangiaceae bacterium NEAU-GS5]
MAAMPDARCAACLTRLPSRARFCPSCGERVQAEESLDIRKTVTVVFCDLVGSTALSRILDPEPLRELMLRYFALMRGCLERHGGVVEKYIGDAVMAVFGVPVVHEDDALRAVRAAAQMRDSLAGFNADVAHGLGVTLNVRIGVNTGSVVAAADPAAAEALISGDAVNLAARLEQHAAPGEVLLGPLTCKALEGVVNYELAPPITMKGFAQPVGPGRLVSVGDADAAVPRRFDLALVNRQDEMALLRRTFEAAVRERGCRTVTLQGDAGIGKSRLAAEFARWARSQGAVVAEGRCPGYGVGGSLTALAQAMRKFLAEARSAAPPESNPPETSPPETDAAEALTILREGLLADDAPGIAPGETVWAIGRVLREIGADRPIVLVLDDMHWAEPSLPAALSAVAAQLSGVALTLLCLTRPDFLSEDGAALGDLPDARLEHVRPLTEDDCYRLVAELDEVVAHDAEMAVRAVSRAEGNPFYLEQIVDVMGDESGQSVPLGVNGLIAYRLDQLATGERRILGLAAVVGRDFTPADLLAAAEDDLAGRLAGVLDGLVRRRLIGRTTAGSSPAYRFDSALIHEVAYDSMPKNWRAAGHERLADRLAGDPGAAEVAGTHWERAWSLRKELGTPEQSRRSLADRAVHALLAGGVRALAGGDPRHAADLLSRALPLCDPDDPRRCELLLRTGEARLMAGEGEAGHRLLTQARDRARAGRNAIIEAHAELQLAYLRPTRQFSALLEKAHETLPVFEQAGDVLGLSRAWLRIGVVEQSRGRHARAVRALRRALGYATRLDAGLEQATVLGALAVSLWVGPLPAHRAIAQCRSLLTEYGPGHRSVRAGLLCPLALLEGMSGAHEEADALLDEAGGIIGELGNARAWAVLPMFVAAAKVLAGDLGAAEAMARQAHAASLKLGDPQLTETTSRDLARVTLLHGRQEEAAELAMDGLPDDMPAAAADRYGLRARIRARQGHAEQALRLSGQAQAFARRTDSPLSRATTCLDHAVILRDLGDVGGSREMARRAAGWFGRKGHVVGLAWTRDLLEGAS